MTEQEWLTSNDPVGMRSFLRPKPSDRSIASDRKLRLFAVACCNRVLHMNADERSKNAVAIAERFADGMATYPELDAARLAAKAATGPAASAASNVVRSSANVASWFTAFSAMDRPEAQADLLRDIFGNPFRPVSFDPSWLAHKVVSMAQAIYDDRGFARLPSLGSALEEEGCNDADILAHCREPGPHVRGCWVIDAVLGEGISRDGTRVAGL